MPFVFVDYVAGFVCSDFLHVDALAFEDVDHLPDPGNVLGGACLEPTDAEAKRVTTEGGWLLQILAEPRSQLVQFDMTLLVSAADDEAYVLAFFHRFVTLEDEAFALCLDEGEASGNAGEDGAHGAADDLLESFDEREFFLVERGVFRDGEDDVGGVPFLQLEGDVVDEEFVAGNGQAVLGIEVCEVRELFGELVAQAWVGEDLPPGNARVCCASRKPR